MLAHERLELRDEVCVGADRELGLRALLEQRKVELLEARDLLLRERLVAELRQRLATPQVERLGDPPPPPRRLFRAGFADEAPHARHVELLRLEPDEIAGLPRLDHVWPERL